MEMTVKSCSTKSGFMASLLEDLIQKKMLKSFWKIQKVSFLHACLKPHVDK